MLRPTNVCFVNFNLGPAAAELPARSESDVWDYLRKRRLYVLNVLMEDRLFVWPSVISFAFFFHGYKQTRRALSISSFQYVTEGKSHLVLAVVSFITAVF